jgi:ABC-type transport system involved in multi-copper enzyme maturation permease subunit
MLVGDVCDALPSMRSRPRIKVWTLAKHEYRAALRSKALIALLATFIVVTTVSILIAAFTHKSKLADYNAYKAAVQAAKAAFIAGPQLFPLQLLRGAIEYVEIIGLVIAIALRYVSVARERSNKTRQLLLSRPVSTAPLVLGRIFSAFLIFFLIVSVTGMIAIVAIGGISGTWLTGDELLRLVIAHGLSIVYMLLFYSVGVILTLRSRSPINGLITGFAVWLLIVMILPQIGDTMDVDNQVPGGLFHALQVPKSQERAILAHFRTYETIRNNIEVASIEKHYERLNFAVIDIKDQYNQRPLTEIFAAKRADRGWLGGTTVLLFGGMAMSMRRKYLTR